MRRAVIWNSGAGAWMFQEFAGQLSQAWDVPVSEKPGAFNYLLNCELDSVIILKQKLFIPWDAIIMAADKRLQAAAFRQGQVPIPETHIVPNFQDCQAIIQERTEKEWCLKFPTACGAAGHRLLEARSVEPKKWPKPYLVQEFIRLKRPEVYRTYVAGGDLFGWVVRRFPSPVISSPWVAHARGARYETLGQAPELANAAARLALKAVGLWDSFGCADLIQTEQGQWLVLEVGTDGLYTHVDRDVGDPRLAQELLHRVKTVFLDAS
jgi:glutathione synthase/RimK-type ligase-like ATP-grasp enzyme